MSWSDRRGFLTLAAAAALSGCGLTPAYGPSGAGSALRGSVRVDAPVTPLGFELVARLEERLGLPDPASYALAYEIQVTERDLALTDTDDITRINLEGAIRYVLSDIATGEDLLSGRVSTFAAYSTTASTVATATARRDAETRLMTALADQLVSRLLAQAGSLP